MDFAQYWFQSAGGYEIDNSLRFRGAQHLSWTPSASSTNRKIWTWSAWVKSASMVPDQKLFYVRDAGGDQGGILFQTDKKLNYYNRIAGSVSGSISTNALHRDPSAWYHIVGVLNATATQFTFFVNGVQQAVTIANPVLDTNSIVGSGREHNIGREPAVNSNFFDGYMAEMHFIDGSALAPTDFGEFNADGVWVPKDVTGLTYGTNGFYLDFSDPADIGADRSGNGNNWTATGFELTTPTSSNYDWVADSPTQNWATLYPIHGGNVSTFSNGNLNTVCNNASTSGGTIAVETGKWYAECVCTAKTAVNAIIGICTIDGFDADRQPNESLLGGFGTVYITNATYIQSGAAVSYGSTWGVSDVIGVALDLDSTQNTVTFYKNGASQGAINIPNAAYVFAVGNGQGSTTITYTANFGQRAFAHTPPTGFEALSTAELLDVPITNPSDHFTTILDTGANILTAAQAKFPNGLWWIKDRSNSNPHQFVNSIDGAARCASIPTSNNVTPAYGAYAAPAGNSFAFCWSAPEDFTGTGGSLASSGKRSTEAGFSIVKYVGAASAQTVPHGLSRAPEFIIVKGDVAGVHMPTYGVTITAGGNHFLNLDIAGIAPSVMWNNTPPTSTVFSVGTDAGANSAGVTYTAYCWHSVPGYSSVGYQYVGNGVHDGPFVYLGFRPALVMIKRIGVGIANWVWMDTERNPYNGSYTRSFSNLIDAEASGSGGPNDIDILSNGFKIRSIHQETNLAGEAFLYCAWAKHPFGGSNVSPSPAR